MEKRSLRVTIISRNIYSILKQNIVADRKKYKTKGGYFRDMNWIIRAIKNFLQVVIINQQLNYHLLYERIKEPYIGAEAG